MAIIFVSVYRLEDGIAKQLFSTTDPDLCRLFLAEGSERDFIYRLMHKNKQQEYLELLKYTHQISSIDNKILVIKSKNNLPKEITESELKSFM